MGKNKEIHKNKNVFKVATVRSIKLKAKAQKIINPKKIDSKGNKISNKDKTANMDRLLQELHKDVQVFSSKAKLDANENKIKNKKITKPLVSKVTPAQTNATASKIEQMQL